VDSKEPKWPKEVEDLNGKFSISKSEATIPSTDGTFRCIKEQLGIPLVLLTCLFVNAPIAMQDFLNEPSSLVLSVMLMHLEFILVLPTELPLFLMKIRFSTPMVFTTTISLCFILMNTQ